MTADGALGRAGRAGCVHETPGIVWTAVDVEVLAPSGFDQRFGASIADNVGGFVRRQTTVDGHSDDAGIGGGDVDFRPFNAVAGEDREPVAFLAPNSRSPVARGKLCARYS